VAKAGGLPKPSLKFRLHAWREFERALDPLAAVRSFPRIPLFRLRPDREKPLRMENEILKLLNEHGSLGYEQIASLLNKRPGEVRQALERLRERELVAVLALGELEGHTTRAASYWRLTDQGREELARD
jgi:hypothetical protein